MCPVIELARASITHSHRRPAYKSSSTLRIYLHLYAGFALTFPTSGPWSIISMNHRADLMPLLYSGSTACPDSQTAIASCDIQATDFDQRNALSYMIASKGQPTASNQLAGHKRNHISGGTKTPILHPPSARASNQFERTLSSRVTR